jgi:hypothetical protein
VLGKRQKVFTPASPYNAVDGGLADPEISGKLCNASLAPPLLKKPRTRRARYNDSSPWVYGDLAVPSICVSYSESLSYASAL